jgi:predicted GIY-YIG superfamily endonuclease
MRKWYVYILRCSDKSYYVGLTSHLKRRLSQHSLGKCHYTKSRLPILIVYHKKFDSEKFARVAEKKLKGWSRYKKEKLISGEWQLKLKGV